ncbi:DddA-like double-stranded DNA deaminase toxin [Stackebrandtia soli]|uniref:DddA-like double-stranded DNA deaminase toxin n=1 Tax=Stackebrandtia soli TaxID=1892856 RepID=UPI0039ED352A
MRRIGWPPSNADPNKTSARGHLFDRNGRRMTGEPIQPHQKGTAPPCDELKEPWRSSEDYTTTWHAERDAAMMIREAVKEGHAGPFALYMNIAPCGRRTPDPPHTPDPRRCDENIARIVPRDVIVYAHIVSKRDPIPSRLRIVGTGEAISQC